MIRSKQSPQIERILSLFKSIRLTQLQCVNMVFPRSDNIETVPLLLNSYLSPHKTTNQKYVLVIKREQN